MRTAKTLIRLGRCGSNHDCNPRPWSLSCSMPTIQFIAAQMCVCSCVRDCVLVCLRVCFIVVFVSDYGQ